jgi:ferredoxin
MKTTFIKKILIVSILSLLISLPTYSAISKISLSYDPVIFVEKESCIGCGLCESISENFILGKDEKAEFVIPIGSSIDYIKIYEAYISCPTNSIKILIY